MILLHIFNKYIDKLQKFSELPEDTQNKAESPYIKLKADLDRYLIFIDEKKPRLDVARHPPQTGNRSISTLEPYQNTIELLDIEK